MTHFTIPLKTVNEANGSHGHWSTKAKRRKTQRLVTTVAMRAHAQGLKGSGPNPRALPFPLVVKLTRFSAGQLDTDALPLSMKSIRDQIADELGVTDGPSDSRVAWTYDQKKCARGCWFVAVEIGPAVST